MALPLTRTTTELLDSLVLSTINTMTSDPAWLVNDRGEKFFRKAAERGRVFSVNDADYVEHLLTTGSTPASSWKYYKGSREASGSQAMGSATSLALTQNGIWSTARSSIQDVASNFVIPEDLLRRPVQQGIDTVAGLLERHMAEFFQEQESYAVLGGSTDSATPTRLAPHLNDTDFGSGSDYSIPSFSLLGLFVSGTDTNRDGASSSQYGDLSAQSFMGISQDDVAKWEPYVDGVDNDDGSGKPNFDLNDGQDVYEYLQKYIIAVSRYGAGEMVTDWMVTPEMYEEVLKYMRTKGQINDSLIANLATTTEVPIAGTMLDFHHFLAAATAWDITSDSTPVSVHPIMGINWNSLRFNMVYGGDAATGKWLEPLSDFQVAEQETWLFKRLHARSCWSLDNGRRSFVYSDRFKAS